LREVEAPTFSDIRLTDGGKIVSPTRWPFLPPERFLVLDIQRRQHKSSAEVKTNSTQMRPCTCPDFMFYDHVVINVVNFCHLMQISLRTGT
jgi:hypothetical protein